jgi:hypothetical protein
MPGVKAAGGQSIIVRLLTHSLTYIVDRAHGPKSGSWPLIFRFGVMIHKGFLYPLAFTFLVSSLRGGLNGFCGTWLRCNSLEWNDHSASLRLALHPKNRTLHPVQLPDLG